MARTLTCPMIVINACEVASILHEHPYKPRDETMLKVWERTDRRTFCIVNAVQNKDVVAKIVKSFYEEAQDEVTKEELSRLLIEDWDKQDETFIQVLKEIFPEKFQFKALLSRLRWTILQALKIQTSPDFREKCLLKEARVETVLIEEAKKLSTDEKRPVSKSVDEICEKNGIKNEELKKALESNLTKERGTKLESKAVKVFGQEKGIKLKEVTPEKIMSVFMEFEGVSWSLQGRADAFLEDKVIEVKNRKNRFMQPLYDLIQLQAYLYIYEKPEGILLERFREDNKETPVKFEERFWKEDVIPALKDFVLELENHVERNISLLKDNKCDAIRADTRRVPTKRHRSTPVEPVIQEKMVRIDVTEELDLVEDKEITDKKE